MVGQLIRLKARMTWNTLSRQPVVLVLAVLGVLYGLSMVAVVAVGVMGSAVAGQGDLVSAGLVMAGAALVGGWWVVPVIFASLDNTLDPRRFAPYVGPSRRFGLALVVSTGVGVGGLFTGLVSLLPALGWFAAGRPGPALAALVAVPVAVAIAFTWSRAFSTWLGVRLAATSSRRDMTTLVATALFIGLLAPAGLWVQVLTQGFDRGVFLEVADIAAWTPMGAPWGVARSLAGGDPGVASAQLLIALATLALGWWTWMRVLPSAMSGRATRLSSRVDEALAAGRVLVDPARGTAGERGARPNRRTTEGLAGVERWQRMGLSPRAASLAQRTLVYWIRDPRLSTTLFSALVFPVMGIVFSRIPAEPGTDATGLGLFFLVFMAVLLGFVTGTLQQYDSTALWILVSSGISGHDERLGRLAGTLPLSLTLMIAGTVSSSLLTHRQAVLIPLLLAVLVAYACTSALSLVVGARWVFPVQPPGVSPLATTGTGQFMTTAAIQSIEFLGGALLSAPPLGLLAGSAWGPVPLWASVPVALLWSLGALWGAVVIGGRLWDAHSVDVLTTIRSWPGHQLSA